MGMANEAMDEEVRRLVAKAAEVLKVAGAREVYVFGSASRGTMRADSDVDLAVSGLPPEVFFKAMGQVADVLGRPFDLIDLDESSPFTQYLQEEGELQRVG